MATAFKIFGGIRYRHRSPENIVDEIVELQDKYKITGVSFVDDVFTVNRKHALGFCEELIKRKVKVDWLCSTRVNLVDDELLKTMKKAGCRTICYGIESGNQMVLDEMRKKIKVEQAATALEKTWQAGIVPYSFFMMGYFGETEESIHETTDFCVKHGLSIGNFSFPTPFPGTELFERAKSEGLIHQSEEWVLEHSKEWAQGLNINLTDIPDKKLVELKSSSEKYISRKILLPNIYRYFKILSFSEFFKYCLYRMADIVK